MERRIGSNISESQKYIQGVSEIVAQTLKAYSTHHKKEKKSHINMVSKMLPFQVINIIFYFTLLRDFNEDTQKFRKKFF